MKLRSKLKIKRISRAKPAGIDTMFGGFEWHKHLVSVEHPKYGITVLPLQDAALLFPELRIDGISATEYLDIKLDNWERGE